MFNKKIYIKVYKDKFVVIPLGSGGTAREIKSDPAFSSNRLLVGSFTQAEYCLKQAIDEVCGKGLFSGSPIALVHPRELIDEELSQVEERVLRELALGAGARKVKVYLGPDLSNDQALQELDTA